MPRSNADESRHQPDGEGWTESWSFDFVADDVAGWACLAHVPAASTWTYHACVVRPDGTTLGVIDLEVPPPNPGLEIRTTGLWADHICETADDHWTLGLEAYALSVDTPIDLVDDPVGVLVGLGFDMEWEGIEPSDDLVDERGYRQRCRVTGELLVGDGIWDLDAVGQRAHRWGRPRPPEVAVPVLDLVASTPVPDLDGDGRPIERGRGLTVFGSSGRWIEVPAR